MTNNTAAPAQTMTREEWLLAAVDALTPLFAEHGETVPTVRVSVGWPGGRGKKNNVIGQCWAKSMSADGTPNIFISPVLADATRVLDVLAHELVHAVDDCKSGHKGAFARIAKAIGLEGPMTATHAGESLTATLREIAETLGEYPHAAMSTTAITKQTTRMLKVMCPATGYTIRMTRKWLDEYGAPKCPCCDEIMDEA